MDIKKLRRICQLLCQRGRLAANIIMHLTDQKKMMTVFCCCLYCFKYINFLMENDNCSCYRILLYLFFLYLFVYLFGFMGSWLQHRWSFIVACGLSSCRMRAPLPHSTWDLTSLTRVWTCVPCLARWTLKPLDYQGSPTTGSCIRQNVH